MNQMKSNLLIRLGMVVAIALAVPRLCQIGWAEEPKFTLNDLRSAYGDLDKKKFKDAARLVRTAGLNPDGFTIDEFRQAAQSAGWMSSRSRRAASHVGEFLPQHSQLHQALEGGFTDQQHTQFHQQLDIGHVRLHLPGSIPEAEHQGWHQQNDRLHESFHQLAHPFSDQEHTLLHQFLSRSVKGRALTEAQHTQLHQLFDGRRQFLTQDLGNIHNELHGFTLFQTALPHEGFHGFLGGFEQQRLQDLDATHEQFRH